MIVAISVFSHAEAQQCPTPIPPGITIVYANGMFTTREAAEDQRRKLEVALKDEVANSVGGAVPIEFRLAYNTNETWTDQIVQVATDYVQESAVTILHAFSGIKVPSSVPLSDKINSVISTFTHRAASEADNIQNSKLLRDEDLQEHVAMYRMALLEGRRVVLIPHSQGNFYVNSAYDLVVKSGPSYKDALAAVGLASPVHSIAGGGDYITNSADGVIVPLKKIDPFILSPNFDPQPGSVSLFQHWFTDYVGPQASTTKLTEYVTSRLSTLKAGPSKVSAGVLDASIEWKTDADIDLYVNEPENVVVYWGATREDSAGRVDLDDKDGYGPEHYVIECGKMRTGIYAIQARIFSSSRTNENVTLTIRTAQGAQTFQTTLESSDVDLGLKTLAWVKVGAKDGAYDFRISNDQPSAD